MRHKVFSLINISGLALGMSCSILILLWVKDELSYNGFHENIDNLYRVMELQHYPGSDNFTTPATPGLLARALKQELPEVANIVRVSWEQEHLLTVGDKALKAKGGYTDPAFFEIFSFPLLEGSAGQVLQDPKSIVISRELAENLFGTTGVLGKVIKINNTESYRVAGVMAEMPENSSLLFDYLMPLTDYENSPAGEWLKSWGNNGILTYLQLNPGTDITAFNEKIAGKLRKYNKDSDTDLFVQAVSEMYLYNKFENGKVSGGRIGQVRLFSVVAVFLLLIACINFMNLATARAAKRAKEVGVRKAIGAGKADLVRQFMLESVLVALLALFVSLNLAGMLLPAFNELTGKEVSLDLSDPWLLLLLLGVALFTGLVSGSYPAFFLSSFDPVLVLKGTARMNKLAAVFRKGLVVFQFSLSGLLIISTLVVYLQLHYIRTKDIGMERENMVYVPLEGELKDKYELVKRELKSVAGVLAVSAADQRPLNLVNSTGGIEWKGKDAQANILFGFMRVDYDFLETMGIRLKEGRDLSRDYGTDTAAFLVNEEAVRLMHMQEPVGQSLKLNNKAGHIIGVMKNFQAVPAQHSIPPIVLELYPQQAGYLFFRLAPGKTQEVLAAVEQILARHNPAFPFEYHFLDEDFEALYKSETIMGQLTTYFAGIAIFISCLGLFGLALFTAEQRKKEIGIRKVLGASVSSIVYMLSKDFLKLVFIANLVALPLGWHLMRRWLEGYADRTELSWWVFAAAFGATLLIAMLTLSFHALKTAVANPVTSIRTE